ncbi:hypothetical protein FJV83_29725 [Mesorhizobium sp. WSM4307]|nr:hypothetical protein FJV83_29725 [Mesorhizobium sp. WSM4307]
MVGGRGGGGGGGGGGARGGRPAARRAPPGSRRDCGHINLRENVQSTRSSTTPKSNTPVRAAFQSSWATL